MNTEPEEGKSRACPEAVRESMDYGIPRPYEVL